MCASARPKSGALRPAPDDSCMLMMSPEHAIIARSAIYHSINFPSPVALFLAWPRTRNTHTHAAAVASQGRVLPRDCRLVAAAAAAAVASMHASIIRTCAAARWPLFAFACVYISACNTRAYNHVSRAHIEIRVCVSTADGVKYVLVRALVLLSAWNGAGMAAPLLAVWWRVGCVGWRWGGDASG